MSKNVTITLAEPIEGHDGKITKLVYREPKFRDVLPVGEPYSVQQTRDGESFVVENHDALGHYAEVLLVEPKEYSLVAGQVGLSDTLKVREAIMGFFVRAAQANAASAKLSMTSPSDTDSNSQASAS